MSQVVASQVVGKRREPGAERVVIDQITRESDGTYLALVGKVGQSCDRRKYCKTVVEALEFAAGLRLGDGVLEERDEWELAEDWEATFINARTNQAVSIDELSEGQRIRMLWVGSNPHGETESDRLYHAQIQAEDGGSWYEYVSTDRPKLRVRAKAAE
jgi:hypothetical protein